MGMGGNPIGSNWQYQIPLEGFLTPGEIEENSKTWGRGIANSTKVGEFAAKGNGGLKYITLHRRIPVFTKFQFDRINERLSKIVTDETGWPGKVQSLSLQEGQRMQTIGPPNCCWKSLCSKRLCLYLPPLGLVIFPCWLCCRENLNVTYRHQVVEGADLENYVVNYFRSQYLPTLQKKYPVENRDCLKCQCICGYCCCILLFCCCCAVR